MPPPAPVAKSPTQISFRNEFFTTTRSAVGWCRYGLDDDDTDTEDEQEDGGEGGGAGGATGGRRSRASPGPPSMGGAPNSNNEKGKTYASKSARSDFDIADAQMRVEKKPTKYGLSDDSEEEDGAGRCHS